MLARQTRRQAGVSEGPGSLHEAVALQGRQPLAGSREGGWCARWTHGAGPASADSVSEPLWPVTKRRPNSGRKGYFCFRFPFGARESLLLLPASTLTKDAVYFECQHPEKDTERFKGASCDN